MAATAKALPQARPLAAAEEDPAEHLMHDPRPRGEMNSMVLESMHTTTWRYWTVTGILTFLVLTCLVYGWYYMIMQGLGVAGVNRPVYWAIFLVNVVYWIGISHAGTFISAILRVLKVESRRPFTRAAELMTTFGLVQAGISVFMHMGRIWLAYWLFPFPNEPSSIPGSRISNAAHHGGNPHHRCRPGGPVGEGFSSPDSGSDQHADADPTHPQRVPSERGGPHRRF